MKSMFLTIKFSSIFFKHLYHPINCKYYPVSVSRCPVVRLFNPMDYTLPGLCPNLVIFTDQHSAFPDEGANKNATL